MKNVKYIHIEESCGKISAVPMGSYPPGTALVLPGEQITEEHLKYLGEIMELGGSVFGIRENRIAIVDI
jgi:arginine/lysine/ornithine decarboxylase